MTRRDLIIETVITSETSVNLHETSRRNIPEDSHLHTCCCENLKPHQETDQYASKSSESP
jgi:hypothetical protein